MIIREDKRSQFVSKSKSADKEKDGRSRYEKRTASKISSSNREYNQIDMNKLFKDYILTVKIPVHGETNEYEVKISFGGLIDVLQDRIERNNDVVDLKTIIRSIIDCFNREDIYMSCTCLHPDTKIKLLDGTTPTVKEMCERYNSGEKLYVYSTDESGDFKPGVVENVWQTGIKKQLIKITLDNGKDITTTIDHLYMLRDGSYVEAQELKVGTSLMPMYFNYSNGYESIKLNSESGTKWRSVYKLVAEYFFSELIKQTELEVNPEDNFKYKVAIHHKDFDKRNNTPENLDIMTAKNHWMYHASISKEHIFTKEVRQKFSETMKRTNSNLTQKMIETRKQNLLKGQELNNDPERKRKQSLLMKQTMKDYYANDSNKVFASERIRKAHANMSEEAKESRSKKMSSSASDPEVLKKKRETRWLRNINQLLSSSIEITENNFVENAKSGDPSFKLYFDSFETFLESLYVHEDYNHKVVSIEYILTDGTPVYDIAVKDFHNFVVDAGVVLHNCPDFAYTQAYYMTRDGMNSGQPENRPSDITNPNDTKGAGCKHIQLVLNNTSWVMKVASVIKNYISYIEKHYPKLYADVIYPALYNRDYEEPVQLSMEDEIEDQEQDETQADIDAANEYARTKNRWTSETNPRWVKKDVPDEDQLQLDDEI